MRTRLAQTRLVQTCKLDWQFVQNLFSVLGGSGRCVVSCPLSNLRFAFPIYKVKFFAILVPEVCPYKSAFCSPLQSVKLQSCTLGQNIFFRIIKIKCYNCLLVLKNFSKNLTNSSFFVITLLFQIFYGTE